mmetsp:Transcript_51321/g.121927  ORF Transcript_51321/g.121927 Transcript_51321/m.121927 type:complete len:217 (-) Transcript_51321:1860-2510(-)
MITAARAANTWLTSAATTNERRAILHPSQGLSLWQAKLYAPAASVVSQPKARIGCCSPHPSSTALREQLAKVLTPTSLPTGLGSRRKLVTLSVGRLDACNHLHLALIEFTDHCLHCSHSEQCSHHITFARLTPNAQETANQLRSLQITTAIGIDDIKKLLSIRRDVQVVHQYLHITILNDKEEELLGDRHVEVLELTYHGGFSDEALHASLVLILG